MRNRDSNLRTFASTLQCPTYNIQRQAIWQGEMSLQDKLYGMAANLQRTAEFVTITGLTIQHWLPALMKPTGS